MRLRLKYELAPANAPLFAADMVDAARDISGITLDYTPASLSLVDDIFDSIRSDGPPVDAVAETLFGFGCYVGEVMTRHGGGTWTEPPAEYAPYVGLPLVIRLAEGKFANPLDKAFKRYENGPADSFVYFYRVFCGPPAAHDH